MTWLDLGGNEVRGHFIRGGVKLRSFLSGMNYDQIPPAGNLFLHHQCQITFFLWRNNPEYKYMETHRWSTFKMLTCVVLGSILRSISCSHFFSKLLSKVPSDWPFVSWVNQPSKSKYFIISFLFYILYIKIKYFILLIIYYLL